MGELRSTTTHDRGRATSRWPRRLVYLVVLGLVWAGWSLGAGLAVTPEPVPVHPEPTPGKTDPGR